MDMKLTRKRRYRKTVRAQLVAALERKSTGDIEHALAHYTCGALRLDSANICGDGPDVVAITLQFQPAKRRL